MKLTWMPTMVAVQAAPTDTHTIRPKRSAISRPMAPGVISSAITRMTPTACTPATMLAASTASSSRRSRPTFSPAMRAWPGSKQNSTRSRPRIARISSHPTR